MSLRRFIVRTRLQSCVIILYVLPQVASVPTNLMAVQEGPISIRVSWSPPTPLGDTTGYRIYYSGGSSGSEDVSGGSTDTYLLTGLRNGESYTISIVATSQHIPSESVEVMNISLCKSDTYLTYMYIYQQWRSQGGARGAIAPPFFKNNVIKTFVIDVR